MIRKRIKMGVDPDIIARMEETQRKAENLVKEQVKMNLTRTKDQNPETKRVVTVSRAQVTAAKGKIITDQRQGKQTPGWVIAVAAAKKQREQ